MKSANEAIARAYALLGTGTYHLGAPQVLPQPTGERLSRGKGFRPGWRLDCIGLYLFCYDVDRHRPGFNVGPWATVSDDINTDSACQDAEHKQELFLPLAPGEPPVPGDLVVYPSDRDHGVQCGHAALVTGVKPSDGAVTVVQSHGPNGAKMAVETSDIIFALHSHSHPRSPARYLRMRGT